VVFPKLTGGDPETFFELLRTKYETTVVPGKFFGSPEHFRIGIAGDTASVRSGLERLDGAIREFFGRG
jgi:aspartate/methionine/tyrosine aminotransferase